MQSNIYLKVAPLLREKKFNIDSTAFLDFMKHYSIGDWIYPNAIHRELNIEIKVIYQVLESMVVEGLIEQYLEIYCSKCQRFTGEIYKTIGDIPEEVYCQNCDNEITDPFSHAVVIYKVVS